MKFLQITQNDFDSFSKENEDLYPDGFVFVHHVLKKSDIIKSNGQIDFVFEGEIMLKYWENSYNCHVHRIFGNYTYNKNYSESYMLTKVLSWNLLRQYQIEPSGYYWLG